MSAKPSDKRPGRDGPLPPDVLQLRLYVAGRSPNSIQALTNLRAMCAEWLEDDEWHLEVVDVFADPMRAMDDRILVTPTLLKLTPPVVQIVGDLSQRETVLAALDLAEREE
jgi:circadian clock protein KaiB